MKAKDFVRKLIYLSYLKTVYSSGFLGQEVNSDSIATMIKYNPAIKSWYTPERMQNLTGPKLNYFGFDCICMIKAILWGWNKDDNGFSKGVIYNREQDLDTEGMLSVCTDISTDFSDIQPGEYLWIQGHAGVYVGNGWAVETTYRWYDGVQMTRVHNIFNNDIGRYWDKHGKLPYVEYDYITKEEKLKETQDAFLYGLLEMLQDIVDGISKPSLS